MENQNSLATVEDVRSAGNLDGRVSANTLQFYLNLASITYQEMLGSSVYAQAKNQTLTPPDNDRLEMSEALFAVALALPALSTPTTVSGTMKNTRVGVGGEVEVFSFTKEIVALAQTYRNMAKGLIPSTYVSDDKFKDFWKTVVMRVFPSLDETPTVAPLHSYEEEVIKDARGDIEYDPTVDG